MNSAALKFIEKGKHNEVAIFGAGCFWGVEESFSKLRGVISTEVGYSGGTKKNPSYEDVSRHTTGHAEVVKIEYDPAVITYDQLLTGLFQIHNPTTPNRQGLDIGSNYRSAIFFTTPTQETAARAFIAKLEKEHQYKSPITTELAVAGPFYKAEDYHQKYAAKHGGGFCHAPINL